MFMAPLVPTNPTSYTSAMSSNKRVTRSEARNERGDWIADTYECPDCMFFCGNEDPAALVQMVNDHIDAQHTAPFDAAAFRERWGISARLVMGAIEWQASPDYPPRPKKLKKRKR